jgi:hypothetical protein
MIKIDFKSQVTSNFLFSVHLLNDATYEAHADLIAYVRR